MLRNAQRQCHAKRARFDKSSELETHDRHRLRHILNFGFGCSGSYCKMSRDRFFVILRKGNGEKELLDFCARHMGGSPIPGRDVLHDGPKLLSMFKAAERAGLVELQLVKADHFVPEKGR